MNFKLESTLQSRLFQILINKVKGVACFLIAHLIRRICFDGEVVEQTLGGRFA